MPLKNTTRWNSMFTGHTLTKKTQHYSKEGPGNVSLGLAMSISQTPALQKLKSRWGITPKTITQLAITSACNNLIEHLLINRNNQYL